ncbi:hypothetical protein [Balneatrix alpica]|uniref:Uncharacterized protein n=1 Tax=Balneatrix alpica TaxID=75684 RepID=A0ABV5ZBZ4_9GAMM|nr:hypothetical protein [Balneatrix alpica]
MSKFGSLKEQMEKLKQQGKSGSSEKRSGLKTFVPVYTSVAPKKKDEDEPELDEPGFDMMMPDDEYADLDGGSEDMGEEEEGSEPDY